MESGSGDIFIVVLTTRVVINFVTPLLCFFWLYEFLRTTANMTDLNDSFQASEVPQLSEVLAQQRAVLIHQWRNHLHPS